MYDTHDVYTKSFADGGPRRTTASIQPETLVPDASATMKVNSKKADFAIVLELPETVERALFGADIESVTQTMYEPLRYSPIAINIETKKDVKMDEALRSLSIWTSAQITKTRDLLVKAGRPDVSIPPLPILVVQGHQWYFAVMEDKIADGNEGYTVRASFPYSSLPLSRFKSLTSVP